MEGGNVHCVSRMVDVTLANRGAESSLELRLQFNVEAGLITNPTSKVNKAISPVYGGDSALPSLVRRRVDRWLIHSPSRVPRPEPAVSDSANGRQFCSVGTCPGLEANVPGSAPEKTVASRATLRGSGNVNGVGSRRRALLAGFIRWVRTRLHSPLRCLGSFLFCLSLSPTCHGRACDGRVARGARYVRPTR